MQTLMCYKKLVYLFKFIFNSVKRKKNIYKTFKTFRKILQISQNLLKILLILLYLK